jgi:tRNA A37 threonylcarbamoyladenosine dehydratase
VGGLVVGIAVIVAIVLSLGGGGGKGSSSSSSASTGSGGATHTGAQGTSSSKQSTTGGSSATTNPAQLSVAVLNGTTTTGLAHHVSEELQQRGYAKAAALEGQPPGSNQVTTVEYTNGHRGDAQRVAHSLGLTQAQPIEGTVASMASSAAVVVIVGLDKAATTP